LIVEMRVSLAPQQSAKLQYDLLQLLQQLLIKLLLLRLVLPPLFFNQQLSRRLILNMPSELCGLHDAPQTNKSAFPPQAI
jgi:hypothetical protein